jgi:hypothetical protein
MMQSEVIQGIQVVIKSMWDAALRKLYGGPASVTCVKGEWKTGKTDFALHIVEELKRLGLITQAAGNVMCFKDQDCSIQNNENLVYIDNFAQLETWLFSGYRKAFLYDEAITSTPSRRAMSEINTHWLKLIPELSKARTHLIVITQEESITEKVFFLPVFHMGTWEKMALSRRNPQFRKLVKLKSKLLLRPIKFRNIPRTKIIFDPYRSAVWRMEPESIENIVDDDLRIAFDYANEISYDDIVKKYSFLHTRKDVSIRIRRAIKKMRKCMSSQLARRISQTNNDTQSD